MTIDPIPKKEEPVRAYEWKVHVVEEKDAVNWPNPKSPFIYFIEKNDLRIRRGYVNKGETSAVLSPDDPRVIKLSPGRVWFNYKDARTFVLKEQDDLIKNLKRAVYSAMRYRIKMDEIYPKKEPEKL